MLRKVLFVSPCVLVVLFLLQRRALWSGSSTRPDSLWFRFDDGLESGREDVHCNVRHLVFAVPPMGISGAPVGVRVKSVYRPRVCRFLLTVNHAFNVTLVLRYGQGSISFPAHPHFGRRGPMVLDVRPLHQGNTSHGAARRRLQLQVESFDFHMSRSSFSMSDTRKIQGPIFNKAVSVNQTLVVPRGKLVTLEAGSVATIATGQKLRVKGTLHIMGSRLKPALVTSVGSEAWGQIIVENYGTLRATNTLFINGGNYRADDVFGHSDSVPVIWASEGAHVVLSGCAVIDSPGKGPSSKGSHVTLNDVHIARVDTGGEHIRSVFRGSFLHISSIPDDDGELDDDDNDGLYLRGVHKSQRPSVVADSIFVLGEDDAIDHNGAVVTVERTVIDLWANEGVACSNDGSVVLSSVSISRCNVGVEAGYGRPFVMLSTSLVRECSVGVRFGDSYDWGTDGELLIVNTKAQSNKVDIQNHVHFSQAEQVCHGRSSGPMPKRVASICTDARVVELHQDDTVIPCGGGGRGARAWSDLMRRMPRQHLPSFVHLQRFAERHPVWRGHNKHVDEAVLIDAEGGTRAVALFRSTTRTATKEFKAELLSIPMTNRMPKSFGGFHHHGAMVTVQELVPGAPLSQHSPLAREPPKLALVLKAVESVHSLPLGPCLHGDIKPDNLWMSSERGVMLIDVDDMQLLPADRSEFTWDAHHAGCARRTCTDLQDSSIISAPECISCGRPFGCKAEVWAAGVVAAGAYTGAEIEFETGDSIAARRAAYNKLVRSVPPRIRDVILNLTRNDASARPPLSHAIHRIRHVTAPTDTILVSRDDWISVVRRQLAAAPPHLFAPKEESGGQHCGFSCRGRLGSNIDAMIKSHNRMTRYKAWSWDDESFLREILVSILDDALATRIVPPCVGVLLRPSTVSLLSLRQSIGRLSSCGSSATDKNGVPTAICQWVPGADNVDIGTVRKDVSYSVFLFLAGCMKSQHNHFAADSLLIMIDNDRCFTPLGVTELEMPEVHAERWESILDTVFQCNTGTVRAIETVLAPLPSDGLPLSAIIRARAKEDAVLRSVIDDHEWRLRLLELDYRLLLLNNHLAECGDWLAQRTAKSKWWSR